MQNVADIPLAIIGMACRLPGADNLDEFWKLLIEGRSGLRELPPDRFDRELYYHPDKGVRNKSYTVLGGMTSEKPFDANASPLPQSLIDQTHKAHLTLYEVAMDACRHAGFDPHALPLRNVGVYVGHTPPSAQIGQVVFARQVAHTAQLLREIDGFDRLTGGQQDEVIREIVDAVRGEFPLDDKVFTMCANAYHAPAFLSRAFDLNGPSMAFDAACASSMRALGHGARALQLGQIDMALIGSASYCSSDTLILFSQAQSVSPSGSRPFGEDADGLVASEGYVTLLIKTLDRAIADGDPISAVIRGIGLSSDGKGKSLWAPRPEGQTEAILRAYGPDISMKDLQYLEMHATSTQVGDATELSALKTAFENQIPPGVKIPIGSVKANVGHTLETAGLASVVKTVLAMQNEIIPSQINVGRLNQKVDWESLPFFVPREPLQWNAPGEGQPRRAAVNAFGIGGLNVHVVIDQYLPSASSATPVSNVASGGRVSLKPESPSEAIAIIGRGAIFPGARTIDALWETFCSGQDHISEVPADRWDGNIGYAPGSEQLWHVPTRLGGFITDFEYDWKAHKVPPKQIASADPLQFMLLDAADQALRDAGYLDKEFDRTRTGVIVGTIFGAEFGDELQMGLRLPVFQKILADSLRRRGIPEDQIAEVAEHYADILLKRMPSLIDETGSFTASTLASRITKTFDLMGGAVAVDSGDASALSALSLSIQSLLVGDCDMMVCAAGHRSMSFATFESMARTGLLADSDSHGPFDRDAKACIPGEGVGVVILKRLADAQRDGDKIRAIIRGVGVARDNSLEQALQSSLQRSFLSAGIEPDDVAAVEAGAKGLAESDKQEIAAIAAAYGSGRRNQPVRLGTVSGQMGNTGGASGVASLLKATFELDHAEIPGNVGCVNPLPEAAEHADALQLATSRSPITSTNDEGRLIAGVTSYSQYNLAYHLLVERPTKVPRLETPSAPTVAPTAARKAAAAGKADWRIVRISAADLTPLVEQASRIATDADGLFAASETSTFNGTDRVRLAIVARNPADLAEKSRLAANQISQPQARGLLAEKGIFYGEIGQQPPRVAFLFPGQGSQYHGMLKSLVEEYPPAAKAMQEVDNVLASLELPSLAALAWEPGDELGKDVWRTQLSLLAADTIVHAAATAMQLRPDRVAGHSFGELAALIAAGSWSFEAAIRATRARCAAIDACRNSKGIMLSTSAPAEIVEHLCQEVNGMVSISHRNAPDQTVVGGRPDAVSQLDEAIQHEGYQTKLLAVPAAFHTPLMEGVKEPFGRALEEIGLEPPRIPLLSSVTNRYVADPVEIRENLVTQMTQPVNYTELIQRLADEGTTIFVEVGPRQVLTGLHKRILANRPVSFVSCNHPKRSGLQQLLSARACVETNGALDRRTDVGLVRIASPATQPASRVALQTVASTKTHPTPAAVESAELNVLRLSGTPFEMGCQHGSQQAEQIRNILRRYADLAGSKWDRLHSLDGAASQPDLFFGLDDFEELRGIAKGADVTLESVIAHNLRLYLDAGSGGLHFAVTAEANPSDGLLHAANEDLRPGPGIRDCLERNIQARSPIGKIPHVTFGIAGQLGGLNGVNARGLAVSTAALLDVPVSATELQGTLHTVLVKRILENAEDVDSAIELLHEYQGTVAWSLCLSHHVSDRLCYVECDGKSIRVQASPTAVVASNHRLIYSLLDRKVPPHSQRRLNRLKDLLGGDRPQNLSVSRAQEALRDHFDSTRRHEATTPTMNTVCRVDNQISIVMQPAHDVVWVTSGPLVNGRRHEFHQLNLKELLVSRPSEPNRPTSETTAKPIESHREGGLESVVAAQALPDALASVEAAAEDGVCSRYVMRVVEAPLAENHNKSLQLNGPALIVGQNPAASALRDRLKTQGATVLELPASDNVDEVLDALNRHWKSSPAPHLFLMSAYDDEAITTLDSAGWNRRRAQGVMLPYLVCQRWFELVSAAKLIEKSSIVAATALGGDFGFSQRVRNVESGGLAGLLKGLKLELDLTGGQDDFRAKVVDASADTTPAQLAEAICRELAVDDGEVEIGYANGKRYVVRPVIEPVTNLPRTDVARGGAWVITGGARGVTAVVAQELGARFGLKLHLIGSSPLPEIAETYHQMSADELKEVRASVMKEALSNGEKPIDAWARFEKALEIDNTLRSYAATGVQATYHCCDVSDRRSLAGVLDSIRAVDGPIQGIIHGSGYERACRFEKKKRELVEKTIAAKVDGAVALMELTRQDPLRYFAAFGSVSGRFGGVGQTDYCMANEMLSKLVDWYRRERPDCAATVFHWHAWDDVGMAVRPESQHIRKLHNIQFMPSREGTEHLIEELRAGLPEGEIVVTERKYYKEKYIDAASVDSATATMPSGSSDRESTAAPLTTGPAALPLMDFLPQLTAGERLTAEMHLNPTVDVFLLQHRYKKRPMLPVVIALEALAEAASLLAGEGQRVVGLKDIELLNGLRFLTDDPQTTRIHAVAGEDGIACDLTADFYNRRGQLLQKDRPYLRGIVDVASQPSPLEITPPAEPETWHDCWYPEEDIVIYHGPAFRCLRQMSAKDNTAYARLVAPPLAELAGARGCGGWMIPPALLDSCFFASGIFLWVLFKGVVAIPNGIQHVRLGRQPRSEEKCLVRIHFRGREAELGLFDFEIFGDDGTVILQVEGYQSVIVAEEPAHAV